MDIPFRVEHSPGLVSGVLPFDLWGFSTKSLHALR